jgi:peptidoglycan/LPS O-acetylase OafA/YrhL
MLTWFGLRSYGIYLFHQPVMGLVRELRIEYHAGIVETAVAVLVVMVLAEASFRFFESHFLRLGRSHTWEQSGHLQPHNLPK